MTDKAPVSPLAPLSDDELGHVESASAPKAHDGDMLIPASKVHRMATELRTRRATSEAHRRSAGAQERGVIVENTDKTALVLASLLAQVRAQAMEEAAGIAESKMTCGCGRDDCYSDRIPEGIALAIRTKAEDSLGENT